MAYKDWMEGLNRFFEWFMNIAYLNVLWIIFTILGGVVLGAAPSTSAMFAVIRRLFLSKEKVPITRIYLTYYRKDFFKVNGLFYCFVLIGAILIADIYFLIDIDKQIAVVFLFLLLMLSVIYVIAVMMFFPVFSHYDVRFLTYIKHSIFIGIMRPLHILIMAIGISVSYYLMLFLPALFLFFGISLGALIIGSVSHHIFLKIDLSTVSK
ncbi:YesL family protein [Alteribacillus sp. JSM 102045]|uniref:YesL family protein n=1 Tax=Alteribacillus sp. JSM 102045 TaxID=1562101 RepID=UPI0035C0D38C